MKTIWVAECPDGQCVHGTLVMKFQGWGALDRRNEWMRRHQKLGHRVRGYFVQRPELESTLGEEGSEAAEGRGEHPT